MNPWYMQDATLSGSSSSAPTEEPASSPPPALQGALPPPEDLDTPILTSSSSYTCVICNGTATWAVAHEDINKQCPDYVMMRLNCSHAVHLACLKLWHRECHTVAYIKSVGKPQCALCRQPFEKLPCRDNETHIRGLHQTYIPPRFRSVPVADWTQVQPGTLLRRKNFAAPVYGMFVKLNGNTQITLRMVFLQAKKGGLKNVALTDDVVRCARKHVEVVQKVWSAVQKGVLVDEQGGVVIEIT